MSVSNKNAKLDDYYGYWQPYPNRLRARRYFQQFDALKRGGPFFAKFMTVSVVAYHLVHYTYQFAKVTPEERRDLAYVIWLKRKFPSCASIGFPLKE